MMVNRNGFFEMALTRKKMSNICWFPKLIFYVIPKSTNYGQHQSRPNQKGKEEKPETFFRQDCGSWDLVPCREHHQLSRRLILKYHSLHFLKIGIKILCCFQDFSSLANSSLIHGSAKWAAAFISYAFPRGTLKS